MTLPNEYAKTAQKTVLYRIFSFHKYHRKNGKNFSDGAIKETRRKLNAKNNYLKNYNYLTVVKIQAYAPSDRDIASGNKVNKAKFVSHKRRDKR